MHGFTSMAVLKTVLYHSLELVLFLQNIFYEILKTTDLHLSRGAAQRGERRLANVYIADCKLNIGDIDKRDNRDGELSGLTHVSRQVYVLPRYDRS
jgi:hypothetical protein